MFKSRWPMSGVGAVFAGLALALLGMACSSRQVSQASPPQVSDLVGGGHILLNVEDVGEAMKAAEAAGFKVLPGTAGSPPDNGMIHLDNGWFIEFVDLGGIGRYVHVVVWIFPAIRNRLNAWSGAELGDLFDWSVDVSDIDRAREMAISNGVPFSKVREFERVQANGEPTSWQLALPVDSAMPFFKSPYVGHVDVTDYQHHENGVRSLAGFTLVVPDLAAARDSLSRTLALAPKDETSFCIRDVEVRLEQGRDHAIRGLRFVTDGEPGSQTLMGADLELVSPSERPCVAVAAASPSTSDEGLSDAPTDGGRSD